MGKVSGIGDACDPTHAPTGVSDKIQIDFTGTGSDPT